MTCAVLQCAAVANCTHQARTITYYMMCAVPTAALSFSVMTIQMLCSDMFKYYYTLCVYAYIYIIKTSEENIARYCAAAGTTAGAP